MFNLDELVKTEEIQIGGEILHINPVLKGFADRYRSKLFALDKKVKAKKVDMSDIAEIHKLIVEYLSNNTEGKKFSIKDLDNFAETQINGLMKHISQVINDVEKK